jgi:hypothetical protein
MFRDRSALQAPNFGQPTLRVPEAAGVTVVTAQLDRLQQQGLGFIEPADAVKGQTQVLDRGGGVWVVGPEHLATTVERSAQQRRRLLVAAERTQG